MAVKTIYCINLTSPLAVVFPKIALSLIIRKILELHHDCQQRLTDKIVPRIHSHNGFITIISVDAGLCIHLQCSCQFFQASDEASLRALEGLMQEFFSGQTTNERKRQIGSNIVHMRTL